MDSHTEKPLPLPNIFSQPKTEKKENNEAAEKIARKRFELKLKEIGDKQPEVRERYDNWFLQTQLLWGKKGPVRISVQDRERILDCALRGEKPIWLDPERRKQQKIEASVEKWHKYTDI